MHRQTPSRAEIARKMLQVSTLQRVPQAELAALVMDIFSSCGMAAEDAEAATRATIYAQQRGTDSHGVVGLPLYVTGLLDGTIKPAPQMKVFQTLPAAAVIDADHGLGLVVSQRAIDRASDFATTYGLGAVAVRNSSHFGTAGYHAELAARRGMIGMAFSNASPAIAPTGGADPLFGTNPIGVAFPVPGSEPIVADLATSMVARSKIRQVAAAGGKTIPEGWALDADGHPTTDPAAALKGSMLGIGGPKGYALSLMVEILCSALSGGPAGFDITYEHVVKRPSGISHFFLAINPAAFAGEAAYGHGMSIIAARVQAVRSVDPANPPRLPGMRGHRKAAESEARGIDIQANLRAALIEVAGIFEARP